MKRILPTLIAMLLALPLLARAETPLPAHVPVGAVDTVYVKVAHGVFMEVRLLRAKNPAETWSDVRMRRDANGRQRNELAKNPEGLVVKAGDIVQLNIAPPPELVTGAMPETTQVTQRLAPAGSTVARRFEQDQAAPAVSLADHRLSF